MMSHILNLKSHCAYRIVNTPSKGRQEIVNSMFVVRSSVFNQPYRITTTTPFFVFTVVLSYNATV